MRYLFIPCILFLCACAATPTQHEQMIAYVTPVTEHATGKSISVSPVIITDTPEHNWSQPQWQPLTESDFTTAIVKTIDHSGLFKTTDTKGPADYYLSANVTGQELFGGANSIFLLLVHYELKETTTDNVTWVENIFSFHQLATTDVFYGADRFAQVQEGAVRKNLEQLITKLNATLPP
jgi:hypothetical protein